MTNDETNKQAVFSIEEETNGIQEMTDAHEATGVTVQVKTEPDDHEYSENEIKNREDEETWQVMVDEDAISYDVVKPDPKDEVAQEVEQREGNPQKKTSAEADLT